MNRTTDLSRNREQTSSSSTPQLSMEGGHGEYPQIVVPGTEVFALVQQTLRVVGNAS